VTQEIRLLSDEEILPVAREVAPLLAQLWASRAITATFHPKWDGGDNYCQIQRDPYRSDSQRDEKLAEHLRQIEYTIIYGRKHLDTSGFQPRAFASGMNDLGIVAESAQILFLRKPREIIQSVSDRADGCLSEFLSEFTVVPRVREAVAA
jgi:hypothetical protein